MFEEQNAKLRSMHKLVEQQKASISGLRGTVDALQSEKAEWIQRLTTVEKMEHAQKKRSRDVSLEMARLQAREELLEKHEVRVSVVADENVKRQRVVEEREVKCSE